jgi:MFS transporter, ACS family, allantoate permease
MTSSSTTSVDKKLETEGSVHAYKPTVGSREVDVAAELTAGKEVSFTPEEAARIRYVDHVWFRAVVIFISVRQTED